MNPMNNQQQPSSAIPEDQAGPSGSASCGDLSVPDDNANVSPAVQRDESKGAIRKIISRPGTSVLAHREEICACHSDTSPQRRSTDAVDSTRPKECSECLGEPKDTVMKRNWSGERRLKKRSPSSRKNKARATAGGASGTDSKCLNSSSSSSSSANSPVGSRLEEEKLRAMSNALGISEFRSLVDSRQAFRLTSMPFLWQAYPSVEPFRFNRNWIQDQKSNKSDSIEQKTQTKKGQSRKKKESSSSSSSSSSSCSDGGDEEEIYGCHHSSSPSSSSDNSDSDTAVYYKYIQEADLPPAFHNNFHPAQPAAANNNAGANVQAGNNNRQDNSSPEPMDYLEMDFDPGQSGDADSDSANAPEPAHEDHSGGAAAALGATAATPPAATNQNNSRSPPTPPPLPASQSHNVQSVSTNNSQQSRTEGGDHANRAKEDNANSSGQQPGSPPPDSKAGPSGHRTAKIDLVYNEKDAGRQNCWSTLFNNVPLGEVGYFSLGFSPYLHKDHQTWAPVRNVNLEPEVDLWRHHVDSDVEDKSRAGRNFDPAVGGSVLGLASSSTRFTPEPDCGGGSRHNVLDASYGGILDEPKAGPSQIASTTVHNSSISSIDEQCLALTMEEREQHLCGVLNPSGPLFLEVMLWTQEEISLRANFPNSRDSCGSTANAIRDVIKTLNLKEIWLPTEAQILRVLNDIKPTLRENPVMDLVPYLRSRSGVGWSHREVIEALDILTKGKVYARFFPLHPKSNVELQNWLLVWMWRGVVPIITTTNVHKYEPGSTPEDDYWCHRIVYGAGARGILMNDPREFLGKKKIDQRLYHESVVEVKRNEVMGRYNNKTDFHSLLELENQCQVWRDSHILGQVMNMVRESRQNNPRSYRTPSVKIPTHYRAGITLVVLKSNKVAFDALLNHPDQPTTEKITYRTYPPTDHTQELRTDLFAPPSKPWDAIARFGKRQQ